MIQSFFQRSNREAKYEINLGKQLLKLNRTERDIYGHGNEVWIFLILMLIHRQGPRKGALNLSSIEKSPK